MADAKYFLDKMEVNGPTAHLSFLSYLTLDIKLYRKEIGLDCTTNISRKSAAQLREVMGNKLWPYSGSAFSKAAAYLTGINFQSKIRDLIESLKRDATLNSIHIKQFAESWITEANEFDMVVKYQIHLIQSNITQFPTEKTKSDAGQRNKVKSDDLFDSLFQSDNSEPQTLDDTNALLTAELERFERYPFPKEDVQSFWKTADFACLRRVAIILLSVPASSAAIERLFSESGIVLTKLLRRLDPEKLTALVYIKYASKYSKLYRDICPVDVSGEESVVNVENIAFEVQDTDEMYDEDIIDIS